MQTSKKAFTLVEILITLSIATIASTMILGYVVENVKISFVNDQKNKINYDIRKLTNEFANSAKSSNYFALYKSFNNADHNTAGSRLHDGQSGDYLVLVSQAPPQGFQNSIRPIERIVGFYRSADVDNRGPVRKFVLEFDPPSTSDLEDLLPDQSEVDDFPQVLELAEGLADGNMFFNFWNKSVMVNGKILHGNEAKRVTDTYNFTISPRG